MIIDHVGIVVKSIEKGIEHWTAVFDYKLLTKITVNEIQNVKVAFMSKKDSILIKLVQPINNLSPVYNFAKKGGGLHHLAFRCDNVIDEVERLKKLGLRIISAPQPGEAFNNNLIAFLFAKQGINIELIDSDEKANIIGEK